MKDTKEKSHGLLAIAGGSPVRNEPLPLEFPGVHHMGREELEAATRVIKSQSLFRYYGVDLQGEVDAFETEFSQFLGVKRALAVGSGTGALHTALSALGTGPGQEIVVPAYAWVAVFGAVINHGAIPVLADIDDSFCLDPKNLFRCITGKTTGIIMVHMSGAPGDVRAIREIARNRNLWLLEDCAQCNGGSVDGQRVGTFGDMGIFSFQMNKNITAGEGGCVVTNNERLYQRAFASHDGGYARDSDGRLIFDDPDLCLWGRGYRLDEIRAAILREQLKKLPEIISAMHCSKYRIRQALEDFPQVQLRRVIDQQGDTGCFLILSLSDAQTARKINLALRAEGIVTWPQGVSNILMCDWGLHLYYNNASLLGRTSIDGKGYPWNLPENRSHAHGYARGTCPNADSLFERSILLAIPSCLTKRDEDDIIEAFGKVLGTLL